MRTSSPLRFLAAVVLTAFLAACSGDQSETPQPAPTPTPAPAPVAPAPKPHSDTAAPPEPAVDQEAERRKEFFEHIDKEGTAPVVEPEPQTATAPAPKPPAPVAKPAPAPTVATAPRPAPKPVPMPKPLTSAPAGETSSQAIAAASTSTRPAPAPAPAPEPGDAVAMVEPAPAPSSASLARSGTTEAIPLRPDEDPVERCGDAGDLDEAAGKGALSNADIACLEEAYALSPRALERERVSVMLLSNAFAAGDDAAQRRLLARHLSEVDSENPEMAYRFALLLMKGGGSPGEIVRWSNVALTNRAAWTGSTYQSRVYSLYKLRAAASKMELEEAESAHSQLPGTDTERDLHYAREETKRYAREWYMFARDTGQDTDAALDLCLIASQSPTWCMQGS